MKLLRLREVIQLTGLSRMTVYRYESSGNFPRRRRVGPNSVRWLDGDIDRWMASRPVVKAAVDVSMGFGLPPSDPP